MGIVQLLSAILEVVLRSGGADKLKELLDRNKNFTVELLALQASLKPPKKSKGY